MLGHDKATDGCWDCYWEEENPSDEFISPAVKDIPGFEGTIDKLNDLTIRK